MRLMEGRYSHVISGASDQSLEFEHALTQELGSIVARQLQGTHR